MTAVAVLLAVGLLLQTALALALLLALGDGERRQQLRLRAAEERLSAQIVAFTTLQRVTPTPPCRVLGAVDWAGDGAPATVEDAPTAMAPRSSTLPSSRSPEALEAAPREAAPQRFVWTLVGPR